MPRKKQPEPQPIEVREFESVAEIDYAINKLQRRVADLEHLDIREAYLQDTGDDDAVRSNIHGGRAWGRQVAVPFGSAWAEVSKRVAA